MSSRLAADSGAAGDRPALGWATVASKGLGGKQGLQILLLERNVIRQQACIIEAAHKAATTPVSSLLNAHACNNLYLPVCEKVHVCAPVCASILNRQRHAWRAECGKKGSHARGTLVYLQWRPLFLPNPFSDCWPCGPGSAQGVLAWPARRLFVTQLPCFVMWASDAAHPQASWPVSNALFKLCVLVGTHEPSEQASLRV
jgi:hypothetical protein